MKYLGPLAGTGIAVLAWFWAARVIARGEIYVPTITGWAYSPGVAAISMAAGLGLLGAMSIFAACVTFFPKHSATFREARNVALLGVIVMFTQTLVVGAVNAP